MNEDIFSQVFGISSEYAGRGAEGTGAAADWLIRAGLSLAAITQILNGVATSAAVSPQQVAYLQNEMRYAQDNYARQQQQNGIAPLLILGGLFYLATRKD